MSASFQMWPAEERGRVENFWLSELKTLFSPTSLKAILEYERQALKNIKQNYELLIEEYNALAKNRVKIAILEKCIAENSKTREFLLTIIHLLAVAEKAYGAMRLPWSRKIELRGKTVNIFSRTFMDAEIKSFLSELEAITPLGFSEFPALKDKGLQNIMDYTKDCRDRTMEMAVETRQCCNRFLEHHASLLNTGFVLKARAHFRLIRNFSALLQALQPISEAAYRLVVPLFHRNKQYATHTLLEFKAQIHKMGIEERLEQNYQCLEQCSKAMTAHEKSIRHLRLLIQDKPLPLSAFFPISKPVLSVGNLQPKEPIPDPKNWNRIKLGMGG